MTYVFYGFSFETGKVTTYDANGRPDLSVNHETIDPLVAVMESSNIDDPFYENGTFASAAEAEAFYNSYNEVNATEYQAIARNIKANQVQNPSSAIVK